MPEALTTAPASSVQQTFTRQNPFAKVVYYVSAASLVYLVLPVSLFAAGWLRLYVAVPVIALVLFGSYRCLRRVRQFRIAPRMPRDLFSLKGAIKCAAIAVLVTVWISLLGNGGYGVMSSDYTLRSNPMLRDLVTRSWPVLYGGDELSSIFESDQIFALHRTDDLWVNGVDTEDASFLVSQINATVGIVVGSKLVFSHSGTRTVRRIEHDPEAERDRVWVTGGPLNPNLDGGQNPINVTRSFSGSNRLALAYPFGWYLPAAVVGKAFGWNAANHFLFAYTVLGELLALFWLLALIRRLSVLVVVAYILFGGLDIVGWIAMRGGLSSGTQHIEWWGGDRVRPGIFAYGATMAHMHWAAHHLIVGLLVGGMLAFFVVRARDNASSGMLMALSLLWSPLAILGMLPIAAVGLYKSRPRSFLTLQNFIVAPILALIFASFFHRPPHAIPAGWVWKSYDPYNDWPRFVLAMFVEFGAYALIASEAYCYQSRRMRLLFIAVIVGLMAGCFYRVGFFNDLSLRMSIPLLDMLFIFMMMACFEFSRRGQKDRLKLMLFALALGTVSGLNDLSRILKEGRFGYSPPPIESTLVQSIAERRAPTMWNQYFRSLDGSFFKYLARRGM